MNLKGRQDKWRLILPDDFIPEEIREKYTKILQSQHSFIYNPIDYVNETIQKIEVLGFNNGVKGQMQPRRGYPLLKPSRVQQNNMLHTVTEVPYRNPEGPLSLIDKTLNIDFRHVSGFLNYFIIFESFFYQYSRDMQSLKLPEYIPIEIANEDGEIYCRLMLYDPVIDGIDMLSLDFTQPVATSQTFRVIIKYSNIDFQFIIDDAVTEEETVQPLTKDDLKNDDESIYQ